PHKPGLLVLAGFAAGCAGWTKNEGLLFIAATAAALLLPVVRRPAVTLRRFGFFLSGLALPLIVTLWFKLTVAPPNDLMGGRHQAEVLQKLLSPERYLTVWMGISDGFWTFGNWIVNPIVLVLAYVILQRIGRKTQLNEGWLQAALICVVVA